MVKTWKIILATLVIFTAGVITGGMVVRRAMAPNLTRSHKIGDNSRTQWMIQRPEFFQRMKVELNLTSEQAEKVEILIRQSHLRTEPLWELINPLLQEEFTRVKQDIRKELSSPQQTKFEELMKPRAPRRDGESGKGKARPLGSGSRSLANPTQTNSVASPKN